MDELIGPWQRSNGRRLTVGVPLVGVVKEAGLDPINARWAGGRGSVKRQLQSCAHLQLEPARCQLIGSHFVHFPPISARRIENAAAFQSHGRTSPASALWRQFPPSRDGRPPDEFDAHQR